MSLDADPGIWKQAANWLWTLLVPMILIVKSMVGARLDKIEELAEGALPKGEFDKHVDDVREDITKLFEKNEATRDLINERARVVQESVERKIESLRQDVNNGFNAIRDDLRQARK
jgi:Mg2+ and Co2+ transporter CorA